MNAEFRVTEKGLCIYADGEELISGICGYIEYPGHDFNVLKVKNVGEWSADGESASCDNLTVELAPCHEGFLVRSTFTNLWEGIDEPDEFTAFAGDLARTVERGIVNRYTEANGNRVCEMQSQIDTVHTVYNAVYDSAENTVFDTTEGDSFVFGAATYEKYFSGVTFSREGRLTAHCRPEAHPIGTSEKITSEWFFFSPCADCVSGLEDFAKTVSSIAGVERSERENPSGFCTWYYYAGRITPDTLRDNMAVLDRHREDLPIKYIQIDDGWYDCWGSWMPNGKFGDMKAIADEIKSHGYLPGIWLAPFGCHPGAQVFADHEDWFVHVPGGGAWRELSFDFTNPEVREYISSIFRRISYDWGFRYIKMDIITGTLAPGAHHDPSATALENYRLGLKTIRESVTPDTFLLACTAPLGGACGLVDGMRVSCDVFERWESLRDVFNSVIKRYYYHRNYFLCDADCLIIRKKENEDEECWRLCTRSDEEIRTYITAMAASGGILMLSDKLPNLAPEQLELISKLFPMTQEAARPLDLMDSFIPGVLDFGVRASARTVAFINWGDSPRDFSVDCGESFVREFWSGEMSVFSGGKFTSRVQPHCAKVFAFTPITSSAIVGSDASLVMQSEWSADGDAVKGKRIKSGERLYAASKGKDPTSSGCKVSAIAENGGYTFYEIIPDGEEYTVAF